MADAESKIEVPRDMLVEADSMLSWFWHRYLPADVRQIEQQRYDRIINALRNAYEKRSKGATS
jgi:hypothetical protein